MSHVEGQRLGARTVLAIVPTALVMLAGAALGTGCGRQLPASASPLALDRDADLGLPVLSLLWQEKLVPGSGRYLPQEFAEPVVAGDAIYVGSHAGVFYALGVDDGKVRWKRSIGATGSRALVTHNRVFIGTESGMVYSLDRVTGVVRWSYQTKGAIQHPPVLVGDTAIFSNDADRVYALDAQTGKWRWQYDRETPEEFTVRGHAGVIALDDRVFTGFADGYVVALNAAAGEVIWVRSLAGEAKQFVDVDTTPLLVAGALYAASVSGGLYALDPADGTERWRNSTHAVSAIVADPDGRTLYFAAADEGLFAIDRQGHVLWRQGLRGGGDPARPLLDADYLYLSLADRGLMIVDKRSGRLLQWFDPGAGISAPPSVEGDRLFVLSNGGTLYAMSVTRY